MNDYHIELLSPANADPFFFLIQNNRSRLEDFFAGTVSKTKTLGETQQYCLEIEKKMKPGKSLKDSIVNSVDRSVLNNVRSFSGALNYSHLLLRKAIDFEALVPIFAHIRDYAENK